MSPHSAGICAVGGMIVVAGGQGWRAGEIKKHMTTIMKLNSQHKDWTLQYKQHFKGYCGHY